MPSGRPAPSIHANQDGSVTVQYKPTEKGVHELNLNVNEKNVEGMPFRCHVDTFGSSFVTAYGDGLDHGSSGAETEFLVCGASNDLDVRIDGPGKAEVISKENKAGVTHVKYLPMSPGEYNISIKIKGKPIHGSPFSAKITGEGRKRSQISVVGNSEVTLGGQNVDLTNMAGVLKPPGGGTEFVLLKKMPTGALGIASFTPKSKGTYVVEVTQDGQKYAGSPFKIDVGEHQVSSPSKVKSSGAVKAATANKKNDVHIDISHAGYGALGISVEGPHRSDLDIKDEGKGTYILTYCPHEPGMYLLNIKFADDHIPGSPYMVAVGGEPSGRVRETITKDIAPAEVTVPGNQCDFQLKIPGTDPLDMEAALTSPSGKTELCEIRDLPQSLYDIKFTPKEEGVHIMSLKHKGLHISGSPFQYTVGKPPAAGPHKVEIGGPGLEKGEVGAKNDFNVYTREAGGGCLSVAVEGPSKAKMEVVDRGKGYTTVSYNVSQEGDYGIHVKYDEQHVPDSPVRVYIAPESGAAKAVTVHGIRDRGLEVDRPAMFTVNLNGSRGTLRAYVDTPSGTEEDAVLQELDQDVYALRFMPKENGIFYVHVKLNEAHIPGSPFPMLIGKMGADPALVLAKGAGLEKGEVGKQSAFTVVTTNAGSGTLNVSIEGTSKVAIMCTEVDDGYEFTYTPMAPGDYLINIKYCNVTIAGCPTMAKVTGKGKASDIRETSGLVVETVEKKPGGAVRKRFSGDASKCVAKGNGLKKAFMNRPQNFTVDVKGAGNGLLTVGMISPTGNPVTELSYKKQRATIYQVVYRTAERGDHQMHIRWGNDEIPGSPFNIQVS